MVRDDVSANPNQKHEPCHPILKKVCDRLLRKYPDQIKKITFGEHRELDKDKFKFQVLGRLERGGLKNGGYKVYVRVAEFEQMVRINASLSRKAMIELFNKEWCAVVSR